jgi:hypothetical protein
VNQYFEYERDIPNIEQWILNLGVFKRWDRPLIWQDRFDISWNDWNRMHYLLSLVPFDHQFGEEDQTFMAANIDRYSAGRLQIQDWQDQGLLVSGIPIKLHTLKEKAQLITNAAQCLEYYNRWAAVQSSAANVLTYDPGVLEKTSQLEYQQWNRGQHQLLALNDRISKAKLLSADLKFD